MENRSARQPFGLVRAKALTYVGRSFSFDQMTEGHLPRKKAKMLKLEHVTTGYNKKAVLHDISFNVKRGDFLGVIGPNGSGKTTLLRVMSKILKPWEGRVTLEEVDIDQINYRELARRMAFVPQRGQEIFFTYSVNDFVGLGRTPYMHRFQLMESAQDLGIVRQAMDLTDISELAERSLEDLSGGERQRAVIAQALAQEPEILLLDEPTAHLDIGHQIEILDLIKSLNEENNLTVLMVSHDLNLAAEYCDRLILLKDGRLFREGSPQEILTFQNIEQVYETLVVVEENPVSRKPHVFLVPKGKRSARL